MKRRDVIKGGVAAALATGAAAVSAPAIAAKRIEITMVSTWPRDFPGLGTGAQRFAERLTAMTDGRIKVNYFAGGERVKPFDSFDEVASGNAQMYHAADYYWKGKHPGWAYFTAVPFGMTYTEINSWIQWGGGQELWDELAAGYGLKCLPCGNTGVQMGGWFRKEMRSASDFKGLKMRIPGLGGDVLAKLGASPVSLPGSQIYENLVSGAIDATEWVGPWNDLAFGFYKVVKNYHYPGFHEPGSMLSVGISKKLWDGMGKGDQAIFEAAATAENNVGFAEFNANNTQALTTLLTKHGVKLHQFPDSVYKAMGKAAQDVLAKTGAADPLTKKVYESFMAFRKKAVAWTKLSDQTYANKRELHKF